MEKIVNREELIKALQMVIPATSKGDSLLSGTDVLVFSEDVIQTYNAHLSISYPIDIGVEGAVKAAELTKIISKMTGENITIKKDEKMTFSSDETELEMALVETSVRDLAAALDLESLEWYSLPKPAGEDEEDEVEPEFLQGLRLCLFSVSKNPSHGTLTGVHVEETDIISTDNFRASFFQMENPMPAFTIPGGSAAELLKIPDLESFSVSNSWVHFQNSEGVIFSAKTFVTEYPSEAVKGLFPQTFPEDHFSIPKGLDKSLERTSLLSYSSDTGQSYVTLYREGEYLVCKGEKEYGSIKDKIQAAPKEWPEGIEISINPQFLKDIMSRSRKFHITDNKLVVFGEGNFYHLMASIQRG
jgi:DNA polymerase III sliding clamp (beta) subunit (PCNA family)